jgi:hypothetical protein
MAKKQNTSNDNTPATTEPKAKRQKRQQSIPGTERKSIEEVDEAAEAFRIARNKRQAATKVEAERKAVLKSVLGKHGIKSYFYEDEDGDTEEVQRIEELKEDVKVNKVKQAKAKADE